MKGNECAEYCEQHSLFEAGDHGYHCLRIPALIVTEEGTVLAFAEARRNDCNDHGDIDLVLKRSLDGGHNWSEMQVIANGGDHTSGNPCPVVDRSTGTVWLPFCLDNRRVFLTSSTDDGVTWAEPADITEAVMDPGWLAVGTGPGHGVQLSSGRLLIPCWVDYGPTFGEAQSSYVAYSDDHGETWHRSDPLEVNASDECEAVELVDGRAYMNMRSYRGKKMRAYAHSDDGGATWSAVKFDPNLPEPSCQGSLVRFTDTSRSERNRVLLSTPACPDARESLTVRMSYDECRTWPVSRVLYAGEAAYSDLAIADDHTVLCLYEADDYKKIVFARFNVEWLSDGHDHLCEK